MINGETSSVGWKWLLAWSLTKSTEKWIVQWIWLFSQKILPWFFLFLTVVFFDQPYQYCILLVLTAQSPMQSTVLSADVSVWCGQVVLLQVLECSWDELLCRVKNAEDLDHIIAAHQQFLDAITTRSLLDSQSHVSQPHRHCWSDIL